MGLLALFVYVGVIPLTQLFRKSRVCALKPKFMGGRLSETSFLKFLFLILKFSFSHDFRPNFIVNLVIL